jgi:hypothetical protein
MPNRASESPWYAEFAVAVREHGGERGYRVDDGVSDRFGYRSWNIEVPEHAGPVQLSLNGETFLLTFPGGFTWPEFGYRPAEANEALEDQLRLLDSYADPTTRTVSVRRVTEVCAHRVAPQRRDRAVASRRKASKPVERSLRLIRGRAARASRKGQRAVRPLRLTDAQRLQRCARETAFRAREPAGQLLAGSRPGRVRPRRPRGR